MAGRLEKDWGPVIVTGRTASACGSTSAVSTVHFEGPRPITPQSLETCHDPFILAYAPARGRNDPPTG